MKAAKSRPSSRVQALCTALLTALACGALAGCTEENYDRETAVTAQGTVDIASIKLGTPDQVFQEAVVTFVRDQSASANSGGKRQYLSRPQEQGGQYMVQVKEGSCFEISVLYNEKPVDRTVAEAQMKRLMPDGAPPQSRVEEAGLSAPIPHADYYFGDDFLGTIYFTDKTGRMAKSLKICNIALLKQAVADSAAEKEQLKPLVDKALQKENK